MVKDENIAHDQWPLALIHEVHVGRYGNVRRARLKVRGTELVRPLTKIVPFEMV